MLKAKFRPPKRQDLIERPRLIRKIEKAASSNCIWMMGAPGSGKTTAALQYLESTRIPYFWYRLDREDSTPAGFFDSTKALTEGMSKSCAGLPSFTLASNKNIYRFAQTFFAQLFENWNPPFCCVIDDYPDVPSDSMLHRLVATAISCLPDNCHTIILSRTLPKGDLVRLLVNREISLIDREDINFDEAEMREFLTSNGISDDDEIKKISEQAEGWIAGVILLLHGKKNIDLKSLPVDINNHQMLFEYFAREEYSDYEDELKKILKYTAYIPQFSVEMAANLVNISSEVIEKYLDKQYMSGHFIEKIDAEDIVKYQYHPLYRHFLQGVSQREIAPVEHKEILRKASKLAVEDNQIEVAASLMAGAEDWDSLIQFCVDQSSQVLRGGRSGEFLWWINKIPEPKREANVWLLLAHARALLMENSSDAEGVFHKALSLAQLEGDVSAIFNAWTGISTVYVSDWGDLHRIDEHVQLYFNLKEKYPNSPGNKIKVHCICSLWWCINWRDWGDFDYDQLEKYSIEIMQENKDPSQRLQLCSALIWHYSIRGKSHYAEYVEAIAAQDVLHQSIDPFAMWNANNVKNLYLAITGKIEDVKSATVEAKIVANRWSFPGGGLAQFEMIYTHLIAADMDASKSSLDALDVKSMTKILENAAYQVCQGWYFCSLLEFEKAIPILQAAEKNCKRAGFGSGLKTCKFLLIFALAKVNKKEQSLAVFDELKIIQEGTTSKHLELKVFLADAWLAIEYEEVSDDIYVKVEKFLGFARENGIVNYFGKLNHVLSAVYGYALSEKIEVGYVLTLIGLQRIQPDNFGRILPEWPWPVRITTLGRFSITVNNQPLDLSRQSARPLQLLKFLVSRARAPIPVPELIESLWPELDGEKGINNYKVTLSRLRKLIGKEAVIQNDNRLFLSRANCWVDAWVVQGLVKRAQREEFLLGKQLNRSHQLLELSKGAFLPNDSDYWLMSYRDEIRKDYLDLLSAVTEGFVEDKKFDEAIELGKNGLTIDDANEAIYISMMKAYQKLNQVEAIENLYSQYQKIIQVRYGIEPSNTIKEIYQDLIDA